MKNSELIQLSQSLNQVTGIKGKDFAYAVFKNKMILESEMRIFEQLRQDPHPDYTNYENERSIVCINYSKKDDNGNPVIQNQQYVIEDWDNFNRDMEEIRVKYKSVLDQMELAQKEISEFMNRESNVDLLKVSFKDLPDDISAQQLEQLKFMIEY